MYVDYFDLDSLWTAPELLANPCYSPKGTKEGDVYSFSIILHEIIYRMGIFAGHGFLNYEGLWKQLSFFLSNKTMFNNKPVAKPRDRSIEFCVIL